MIYMGKVKEIFFFIHISLLLGTNEPGNIHGNLIRGTQINQRYLNLLFMLRSIERKSHILTEVAINTEYM